MQLINSDNDFLGKEKYYEILNSQYNKYLDTINSTTNSRITINTFFTSLNSIAIALIGLFFPDDKISFYGVSYLTFFGIGICVIWLLNIKSFQQLNKLKFAVLEELEKELVANIYQFEWHLLKTNKFVYFRQNKAQKLTPYFFILFYIVTLIISYFGYL